MKISQKQASLLANEIVKRLKAAKVQRVPEVVKDKLKKFIAIRNEMKSQIQELENQLNKHDGTLRNIVGNVPNIRAYNSLSDMIERIEEKSIPSVSSIEDEIILKSMFANEDDMEKFVNSIVSKYSKKIQPKIVMN